MDVGKALGGLVQEVIKVLPISPFAPLIEQFSELPYLGFVNWFLPVGQIMTVMTGWLLAIAAFYLYQVIARWVKLIGS